MQNIVVEGNENDKLLGLYAYMLTPTTGQAKKMVIARIFLQCNTRINLQYHNQVNQIADIKSISKIQGKQ